MIIEQLVELVYEVDSQYWKNLDKIGKCPAWRTLTSEQKQLVTKAILFVIEHPHDTAEEYHSIWKKWMEDQGWVFGFTFNIDNRTHPGLLDYDVLPESYQGAIQISVVLVKHLRGLLV